jgi:hypothetical protein
MHHGAWMPGLRLAKLAAFKWIRAIIGQPTFGLGRAGGYAAHEEPTIHGDRLYPTPTVH